MKTSLPAPIPTVKELEEAYRQNANIMGLLREANQSCAVSVQFGRGDSPA